MYSTCTFCHSALGTNDAIEVFPVGRRLAFDAAKGRLWVVCKACKQWNLTPLEERWEAIETAERLYRDTKLRASTDQVGLARLRDGTELIRIGTPLRPEFAAWRYADRFSLRLRRYAVRTALLSGGGLALSVFGLAAGLGALIIPQGLVSDFNIRVGTRRVIARFADEHGVMTITHWAARAGRIVEAPNDALGWQLSLPVLRADVPVGRIGKRNDGNEPRVVLSGVEAVEVARRILPRINEAGARRATVASAVAVLEEAGDLNATFSKASRLRWNPYIGQMPTEIRLALEMASHEDLERRALDGELATLEASWKEAEQIAAIADSLTLPARVVDRLARIGRT